MKILVTGGAGFIGSTIVDAYIAAGHRVWALDNESTGRKSQVNPKATFVRMDVLNESGLRRLFQRVKFDVVNHHAAQIDVRRSVADPLFDARVNVLGLLSVLEQARAFKAKKVLFSSSGGTVYGECARPANEGFPENPLSPYGVTKLAGEKYIRAYGELHGLRYTIFRYANVFGPRQDPHGEAGVVAIFSGKLLRGEPGFIFGDGKQTRDFVYVKDVARANVLALTKGPNAVINIGTRKETSVNELWSTMASVLSSDVKPIRKPARTGELRRSVLDFSRARTVLGWTPRRTLREGLKETIDYFAQLSGSKIRNPKFEIRNKS